MILSAVQDEAHMLAVGSEGDATLPSADKAKVAKRKISKEIGCNVSCRYLAKSESSEMQALGRRHGQDSRHALCKVCIAPQPGELAPGCRLIFNVVAKGFG